MNHFIRAGAATLFIALAAAVPPAAAQHLQYGIKAGPAFTTVAADDDSEVPLQRRIAATLDGFVAIPVRPAFAIQIEAMSSPRGVRLKQEGFDNTLTLRYFEVPVLARLGVSRRGENGWYVVAGGYAAIRTSAAQELSSSGGSIISGSREDVGGSVKRYDRGLVAGAGVELGRFLVVEGRYSRGLADVNDVEGALPFRNRALTFMAGVRF